MAETNNRKSKNLIIRMTPDKIRDLKIYCAKNDMNMTEAIKSGLALLMASKKEGSFITSKVSVQTIEDASGLTL